MPNSFIRFIFDVDKVICYSMKYTKNHPDRGCEPQNIQQLSEIV